MNVTSFLRSAISVLFRRRWLEGEIEEELRAHIGDRADALERSGIPRSQAERQARIEFGGYERVKEECRQSVGIHFFETLLQDAGFAARLLRKAPGFAIAIILTLALGIGANTAIFSVVYAVLLRPLPYTHPDQLVLALENNLQQGVMTAGCSYQNLMELRRSGIFAEIAGVNRHDLTLTGSGDPTTVRTMVVTPEIFPLLNVNPLVGRYLVPADETKGALPVVVMSEGLWRRRFGGNPSLIGSAITLDQRPFTVVGIMPESFRAPVFADHQEIWIPVAQDPLYSTFMPQRELHWLPAIARMNPGVSLARAQSEAGSISRTLAIQFPSENGGWAVRLEPLQTAITEDIRTPLLVLLGAVGLVLLLACVNIANLLLARATSRTREVALRQALGAGRSRIVRQLLTESAVLGLLGAMLGLAVAYWSIHALALLLPREIAPIENVQIDGWVLIFSLVLALAASIAFGLAPALLSARSNVQSNLRDGAAQSGSAGGRSRLRRLLAAGEIGVAVVLVSTAGLMVRSLVTMTMVNPGFNMDHIFKAQVSLPRYQYSTREQWTAFTSGLLEKVQSQPGLQDSALGVPLPLADGPANMKFSIVGHAPLPPGTPSAADYIAISPEYFRVMEIPLLRGRFFAREDSMPAPPVTIVSESLARFYFGNENPIGQKLEFSMPPNPKVAREIVGIVGDVRDSGLAREPGPMMYVPFAQAPLWGSNLVIRSTAPSAYLAGAIRQAVNSIDKNLPVTDVATMPDVLDKSIAQPKFRTFILGGFGMVALLLAAAGVFGVVSHSVAGRAREFGVRAALGASPESIGKMILREGLWLAGAGLCLGLSVGLGCARLLKSELYGVATYDPATFLVTGVVLLLAVIAACYVPARRAMRVDPMIALRAD